MGIGTAGSLGGGIYDAATAPARKRRFLEDEQKKAKILALRNQHFGRYKDIFPTNALDAQYNKDAVMREAEENPAYNANPLSFLPFVQNATELAGGIYDYANAPAEPPKPARVTDPQMLQQWRPGPQPQHSTPAVPGYEPLPFGNQRQYMTPSAPMRRWR
jgi:hypothetical protein